MIRWLVYLILLGVGWEMTSRFCRDKTDGFSILHIQSDLNDCPLELGTLHHTISDEALSKILSQPFSYLTRGGQAFVFVSQDGQYVLKLMKGRYYALYDALHLNKRKEKALRKLERDALSYSLAYEKAPDLTAMVYLHLRKEDSFHHKVKLIDKLGIAHLVDLNTTTFLIQKRGESMQERLQRQEPQEAQKTIAAFVKTMKEAALRGIADDDPGLYRNFGFVGDTPFFIDVGRLMQVEPHVTVDLDKMTQRFRRFLNDQYPSLIPGFDEELQTLH